MTFLDLYCASSYCVSSKWGHGAQHCSALFDHENPFARTSSRSGTTGNSLGKHGSRHPSVLRFYPTSFRM